MSPAFRVNLTSASTEHHERQELRLTVDAADDVEAAATARNQAPTDMIWYVETVRQIGAI